MKKITLDRCLFACLLMILSVSAAALLQSCNSDGVIEGDRKALIEFDRPDGIYVTKAGVPVLLSPVVTHGGAAPVMEWSIDGVVVGKGGDYEFVSSVPGEYYVLFSVTNGVGTTREEVMVRVMSELPPGVSLALDGGMMVQVGQECRISPDYSHDSGSDFGVEWFIDGVSAGHERDFAHVFEAVGTYIVKVVASNSDGATECEVTVTVVDKLPVVIAWPSMSLNHQPASRATFAGRGLLLAPTVSGASADALIWSVDGIGVGVTGASFLFTPERPGTYRVTCSVDGVSSSVDVECVDVDEAGRRRAGSSAATGYKIREYVPAPGQFIGDDTNVGGMTSDMSSMEAACRWAEDRLARGLFVSLGAWGGYMVVEFDRSVDRERGDGYAFTLSGNAIASMNEPGIVWVSQDVNGNGLPDDEWYELKGSEFATATHRSGYSVTYYRPGGDGMDVMWRDCLGIDGRIERVGAHLQPSYYPKWVDADSYTLYGSRLEARTTHDVATDFWENTAYGWGYADNLGSDIISASDRSVGFRLANAVRADGVSVVLQYVDFVRIQSGVMGQCGRLGEMSTEITGVTVAGS